MTHYATECPDEVDAEEVEVAEPPTGQQTKAVAEQSEALLQQRGFRTRRTSKAARFRSLPLEELGSLPDNTTSLYLTTRLAQYKMDAQKLVGQFFLSLEARDKLPLGAYLEAHFPNPANPDRKQVVDTVLKKEGGIISMFSPESDGFKCWNYEVEVFVYRDDSKNELLDTHRQTLQSQIDLSLIRSAKELALAIGRGRCPSAHQGDMEDMPVAQLEALCEREREKHLKTEREEHIRRCIKHSDKQPEWCENYYADWGDARRLDIKTLLPALYYDLPECVAAKNARENVR